MRACRTIEKNSPSTLGYRAPADSHQRRTLRIHVAKTVTQNNIPANTTGTENTTTATVPTIAGDPPTRSKGNQNAIASPASKPAKFQPDDNGLLLHSTIAFASNSATSIAEITIPFTCHVGPKEQRQPADHLRLQQQKPCSHAKKNKEDFRGPFPKFFQYSPSASTTMIAEIDQ